MCMLACVEHNYRNSGLCLQWDEGWLRQREQFGSYSTSKRNKTEHRYKILKKHERMGGWVYIGEIVYKKNDDIFS